MASLQLQGGLDLDSYGNNDGRNGIGSNKLTKHRSGARHRPAAVAKVKPILKKLHAAHAERRSLDLDRAWEEQRTASLELKEQLYGSLDYGAGDHGMGGGDAGGGGLYGTSYPLGGSGGGAAGAPAGGAFAPGRGHAHAYGHGHGYGSVASTASSSTARRSVRDISFTLSSRDVSSGTAAGRRALSSKFDPAAASGAAHLHGRSTSGTSHLSHISAATTTSARNGSFIHPFQQTPRTSTPPMLSYSNSVVSLSLENTTSHASSNLNPNTASASSAAPLPSQAIDASPTITEDSDDDDSEDVRSSSDRHHASFSSARAASNSQNPQRPSLADTQHSSSLSDGSQTVRGSNSLSGSGLVQRLGHSSVNQSTSDLQTSSFSSAVDSPLSIAVPTSSTPMVASPSLSSPSPLSPLRQSLDMGGFRIRSRSEVDTATHQEQVREARRKFEAKERAKEEKYAREQSRKQERADSKEAQRAEARIRNGSFGNVSFGQGSLSSSRNSSSIDARPAASRKSTGAATHDSIREKNEFESRDYDDAATGHPPAARFDDVHFETIKRRKTAKRKTTGVWTAFMLWLRTRLLKVGRR